MDDIFKVLSAGGLADRFPFYDILQLFQHVNRHHAKYMKPNKPQSNEFFNFF
jgi:hypothetical protein